MEDVLFELAKKQASRYDMMIIHEWLMAYENRSYMRLDSLGCKCPSASDETKAKRREWYFKSHPGNWLARMLHANGHEKRMISAAWSDAEYFEELASFYESLLEVAI